MIVFWRWVRIKRAGRWIHPVQQQQSVAFLANIKDALPPITIPAAPYRQNDDDVSLLRHQIICFPTQDTFDHIIFKASLQKYIDSCVGGQTTINRNRGSGVDISHLFLPPIARRISPKVLVRSWHCYISFERERVHLTHFLGGMILALWDEGHQLDL